MSAGFHTFDNDRISTGSLNNQASRVPREQVAEMARGVRELWNGVFGDSLEA